MKHERVEGGECAAFLLMSQNYGLLIRTLSHPSPKWKLPVETNKPPESILHTLKSGLEEETGLKNIKFDMGPDGKMVRFNDPRILKVVQFGQREELLRPQLHYRYLFGILTTDEIIMELSGKYPHTEELNDQKEIEIESLETKVFPLSTLMTPNSIPDILRQHAELIHSIRTLPETEIK